MSLLKPVTVKVVALKLTFTFHYVSIKTVLVDLSLHLLHLFTFHYVSIKTQSLYEYLRD